MIGTGDKTKKEHFIVLTRYPITYNMFHKSQSTWYRLATMLPSQTANNFSMVGGLYFSFKKKKY